ncbi:MAG TPA: hypothetical protein VF933_03060 [Streptosporangiaceae bacterium]
MSKQEPGTVSSGDDPDVQDEAGEDGLMREILRTQEHHREGGIEPEFDAADQDPEPGG